MFFLSVKLGTGHILPTGGYDTNCGEVNTEDLLEEYKLQFAEHPDVLSVQQAATLADATIKTVNTWIRKKHIRVFYKTGAYHIPKLALIEYLSSPLYRSSPSGKRKYTEKCCAVFSHYKV